MASRIPNAYQLRQRAIQISTPRRGAGSVPSVSSEYSEMFSDLETLRKKNRDEQSSFELARAESDFLIRKSFVDKEVGNSKDWQNMEGVYRGEMNEALGRALSSISDPGMRAAFRQKHELTLTQGAHVMAAKAFEAERDEMRADVENRLEDLARTAMEGDKADVLRVMETAPGLLTSRYFSAQEKENTMDAFRKKVLMGRLEVVAENNPWKAKALTTSDVFTNNIDPDELAAVRSKLDSRIKSKTADVRRQQAQDIAESLADTHDVFDDEVRKKIFAIKDVQLQDEALRRTDIAFAAKTRSKQAESTQAYESLYDRVKQGQDPASFGEYESLLPSEKNSLNALFSSVMKGDKTPWNYDADEFLVQMANSEKFDDIREFIKSNGHMLADQQRQNWWQVGMKGAMTQPVLDGYTDQEVVNNLVPKTSPKLKIILHEEIRKSRMLASSQGRKFDDRDRQQVINSVMRVHSVKGALYGTNEKPYLHMSPEERVEAWSLKREKDPRLWAEMTEKYAGQEVTAELLMNFDIELGRRKLLKRIGQDAVDQISKESFTQEPRYILDRSYVQDRTNEP